VGIVERRNFIINFLLWVLSFVFGYKIGEADSTIVIDKDGNRISEKMEILNKKVDDTNVKVKDIESLKAKYLYNLVGDGKTDNTAGLQQYFNHAVNLGFAYLPYGTYRFTSKLIIPDGIRIIGDKGKTNQKCTTLLYDGPSNSIAVEVVKLDENNKPTSFWGLSIENVAIVNSRWKSESQDFGTDSVGIKLNLVSEGFFLNFQATGFKIGILSAQANICDFIKCYVTNNQYGIWLATKDKDGNDIGMSEMNNFTSLNFWNNETHVVLGGESNFFMGCHMEQAKNVFLLDNQYGGTVMNFECRNANIRNGNYGLTDHTNSRLLKVVQRKGIETLIATKIKFSNINARLHGSESAIDVDFINDSGSKKVDVTLEDTDIYGIKNVILSPNFSLAGVSLLGKNVFKTGFVGDGSTSEISPDQIKLYGISRSEFKNVLHGSLNLGSEQTGEPKKGDIWFDKKYNNLNYHDGTTVRYLDQLQAGPTSKRPSTLYKGRTYFDTDLNKLIIHKGDGEWVDAMGTRV
jgi:hypothetical protein